MRLLPTSGPAVWALDLDGTLLGPDHRLHPDTLDALVRAHDLGVHVVIATGRIRAATAPVLDALPFVPWVVCCGGQTVIAPGEAPQVTARIHAEHVADVLRRATPFADVAVQLYWPAHQAMWRSNDAGEHLERSEGLTFERLATLPDPVPDELIKIVLTAHDQAALQLDGAFRGALPYSYTPTGARYRDVLPRGVDKGAALDRVLARTGWPADRVLVAGDNANDVPMFQRARWRLAVGERCPALVALATERVATNEGGAVGRALSAWLDRSDR